MDYIRPVTTVDTTAPLIYMWEIHDQSDRIIGRYIGKANGGEKRPTQHYSRNVEKLRRGQPYRNGKNYRRVHYALADAVEAGHKISLSYLCNVPDGQDIFEVEMRYIREYGCSADDGVGLNGAWKGPRREVASVLATSIVAPSVERNEKQALPDLEDFLEHVQDCYTGVFDKIESRPKRYSLWKEKVRILRASQSGPAGKVRIKLVRSSTKENVIEHAWDGSDDQLDTWIQGELAVFAQRNK